MKQVPLGILLSENPIFASLPDSERENLERRSFTRKYQNGDYIVHNGDIWPFFFLISSGRVKAVKDSSEGRSLVVASFGQGDVFWGLDFFHAEMTTPVSLIADGAVVIHVWLRENILPIFIKNGQMSWELCRLMVQRMQHASSILEEMAFQPVTGRVANLLLEEFSTEQDHAARHMTLDEMAARVGTTREMVCRILYRFAEEGAIQINRTEFVFTDRQILRQHVK